jgi:hypothetical protein
VQLQAVTLQPETHRVLNAARALGFTVCKLRMLTSSLLFGNRQSSYLATLLRFRVAIFAATAPSSRVT